MHHQRGSASQGLRSSTVELRLTPRSGAGARQRPPQRPRRSQRGRRQTIAEGAAPADQASHESRADVYSFSNRHHSLATMLVCRVANSLAPSATVIATFQVPPIESWPLPRYRPWPSCWRAASLRIAGMFIEGIAGIVNTAFTFRDSTGEPSGFLTVTTTVLSPLAGGFGSVPNVTTKPSDAPPGGMTWPTVAAESSSCAPQPVMLNSATDKATTAVQRFLGVNSAVPPERPAQQSVAANGCERPRQ